MIMEFSVKWIIDSIQTIRPCLIGRTKNEHVQSHSMIQSPTGLTAKGSLINYHHILQDIYCLPSAYLVVVQQNLHWLLHSKEGISMTMDK